ncbi:MULTISPECIES: alpha/beta hydrolase [unclassified Sphingomonas]|uniref:alpha/beta fold hydrolase n=1 Tax=unclassified Sphingomonas TaxID=196159 RepID=UPI002269B647|nr:MULTISPECIES: alpha/beta hydrolase [unclassified Sphingomonas]
MAGHQNHAWQNCYWTSPDGLRLHYRDYPGDETLAPILCFPGLTRNARDFEALAARLAGHQPGGRRLLAIDLRGRGKSDHAKEAASYVPATYVADIQALLAEREIGSFVAIGTSLGGIVAMLLAAAGAPVRGLLLNDVGPELDPVGIARIRGYVGRASVFPTWMHAARAVAETNGDAHPGWRIEQWLAMAKRLYRLNSAGRIVLDYDLKIGEAFRVPGQETGADMWGAFATLRTVPVLIARGARSDVLAAATAARMVAALDDAELVTVAGVGHSPLLTEPELEAPIERWLARISG